MSASGNGFTPGPTDPAQVDRCARAERQQIGKHAAFIVRGWAKLGELDGVTHYGNGASYHQVADAIERMDAAGEPRHGAAKPGSWTEREIEGSAA